MKKIGVSFAIILALVLVFMLGPQLDTGELTKELPGLDLSVENVEEYVEQKEAAFNIRPDNEARIVWASDSLREKTEFSILYLHGFSASWYEGYPVHQNFARTIGANLYLSRLKDHGLNKEDALINMEPSKLYETAKEALVIAQSLGEKVIVMGTSTGGTLALQLAADFPEMVHALILLSPNVAINNPAAFLLDGPWGLEIARLVGGSGKHRNLEVQSEMEGKHWYHNYRWEGTVYLGKLISMTMRPETFQKVNQAVFLGYYYKNEEEQDQTVRVDAALDMFDELATPIELKREVAFPNAGAHVIGCEATSGSYERVEAEIIQFYKEVIQP